MIGSWFHFLCFYSLESHAYSLDHCCCLARCRNLEKSLRKDSTIDRIKTAVNVKAREMTVSLTVSDSCRNNCCPGDVLGVGGLPDLLFLRLVTSEPHQERMQLQLGTNDSVFAAVNLSFSFRTPSNSWLAAICSWFSWCLSEWMQGRNVQPDPNLSYHSD